MKKEQQYRFLQFLPLLKENGLGAIFAWKMLRVKNMIKIVNILL